MTMRLAGLLPLMLSFGSPVDALELPYNSELHGFVSQSYLISPDNPYVGTSSDDGSFKFREIGINGFTEFSTEFRVAGQVLSRYRDQADDGDLRVDFLLADYQFFTNQYSAAGVRVGRVKNSIGFYNATRDIPSARPSFNVPESIYFEALRDTLLSTDGIDLYGSALISGNQINWELTAGRKTVDSENFEYYAFAKPVPGTDKADVALRLFHVNVIPSFQKDLRLGLSIVDVDLDLKDPLSLQEAQMALVSAPPGDLLLNPQNYVTGAGIDGFLTLLSAQYSYRNWVITAEYFNLKNEFDGEFVGNAASSSATTEAYFLQTEWFPSPTTSVFARYEELYLRRNDRSGDQTAADYNPYRGFGRGWTLGSKWSFRENWSVSGQASFNEGTAWLPNFKGIENQDIKKHWNYYVFSLNYQF
ncbi:hypothetical protein [Marinobacter sp. F3R08]|uniref:hypothetical protein n=1 Tax=Marinobacter sp. F3R08 TaxID=2841559 RepID=UPI001C088B78|nr:hypothetical protein [Marinobacter sp. F3R08]MBU2955224.1 hypothetical protein [Marinobacter sp. F3R08]